MNKKCIWLYLKPIALLFCIYAFVCSLELMNSAFRLLAGLHSLIIINLLKNLNKIYIGAYN